MELHFDLLMIIVFKGICTSVHVVSLEYVITLAPCIEVLL